MMKKLSLLALLLCLALSLTACAKSDIGEYYQHAQLYLGAGDYDYAADLFSQLGEYKDSADYALYARGMQAIEEEDYALARANMEAVAPFKSSERVLTWLDAVEAEKDGELEEALALYEALGSFADAHLAVERLEVAIPEAAVSEGRALMARGDYAAARDIFLSLDGYGPSKSLAENCTTALNKAAYSKADDLYESGDLRGAMDAFTALGDTLDAVKRAAECLTAMHVELDARFASVTLADAPALMDAYAALNDETAQARIAEITARFGKNLDLVRMEEPLLLLGAYPALESGEEQPVCWRVIRKEGSKLTLLSESVLDASAEAAPIALILGEAEQAAIGEIILPAMTDLAARANLTCAATPYALAQGAMNEEGSAAYWLRDSLENGMHPIIGAAGAMTLPQDGATPGVRLMTTLDLDKITFTAGSGTAEDPFRAE